MKNVFTNLLNWVLEKGPSKTKKDQDSSKKDQVKRTELGKKRTKWGTSKVQAGYKLSKKGTGLAGESLARFLRDIRGRFSSADKLSCSWVECSPTLEEQRGNHPVITHKSPTNHPLLHLVWKYAACITLLLTLVCGNVWGA